MTTKTGLTLQHFFRAYEHAKGNYSMVMARRVFYAVRDLLHHEHGIDLAGTKSGYFNRFQKTLIELFDKDSALEEGCKEKIVEMLRGGDHANIKMENFGFGGVHGVVYANTDSDSIEHVDCRGQESL